MSLACFIYKQTVSQTDTASRTVSTPAPPGGELKRGTENSFNYPCNALVYLFNEDFSDHWTLYNIYIIFLTKTRLKLLLIMLYNFD